MTTVAKTHDADQPGVLIQGSESVGAVTKDREPEECEGEPREEDENEGETRQEERMSDDAAQQRSDVCGERGKSDKRIPRSEQEVWEVLMSQEARKGE